MLNPSNGNKNKDLKTSRRVSAPVDGVDIAFIRTPQVATYDDDFHADRARERVRRSMRSREGTRGTDAMGPGEREHGATPALGKSCPECGQQHSSNGERETRASRRTHNTRGLVAKSNDGRTGQEM